MSSRQAELEYFFLFGIRLFSRKMSVRCYEKFRDKSDEINGLMSFCLSPNVFLPFS